jgi:hypothetical protein
VAAYIHGQNGVSRRSTHVRARENFRSGSVTNAGGINEVVVAEYGSSSTFSADA